MIAIHADAVVTGDDAALRDAAVVVDDSGRVVDVGAAGDLLPRHAGATLRRVRGALLPGLVNAHTHVELSALRGQVPGGGGFVPWVEHMIGVRSEVGPEDDAAAIERAVDELDAAGTVAVGEVTNSLSAVGPLARRGIVGCVFHEVFGVTREAADRRVAELSRVLEDRVGAWPSTDLVYAPTPHTVYTTHPSAVRALLRQARERGSRASVHLAEHAAERRFLEHGDGPIVDFYGRLLKLRLADLEAPGKPPVVFADELGALAPDVLCVHLTDARPEELVLAARRGAPVVFCPRSNLFIEGRLPPLLGARTAGLEPALGTDSLASNASLDVLAECRALADRFPSVPARDLVQMATWNGARALGREDVGRVARGSRPGLFAIEGDPGDDPCTFVLKSARARRRWIVRRTGASS
ncbi:MAG TPA: amidohydrolase family protein [Polyangiaceae bacterium]|nr:amidohydrolase family protein [Polyangiaceae bacterium]